jgi:hypothetical protein
MDRRGETCISCVPIYLANSPQCYCDNEVDTTAKQLNLSSCAMSCAGNQFEVCGDSLRLNSTLNCLRSRTILTPYEVFQLDSDSNSSSSTTTSSSTDSSTESASVTTSIPSSTQTGPASASALPTGVYAGNANFTFYGCAEEPTDGRALETQLASSSDMTPEKCLSLAAAYSWAGVEYSSECWAGMSLSSGTSNASLSDCSMTCSGDDSLICGGADRLSCKFNHPPGTAEC